MVDEAEVEVVEAAGSERLSDLERGGAVGEGWEDFGDEEDLGAGDGKFLDGEAAGTLVLVDDC